MPDDILNNITENIGESITDGIVVAVKSIFGSGGFVIFACEGGFTVKGKYGSSIEEGARYIISGTVGTYGNRPQISCTSIELIPETGNKNARIASFLEECYDGIGKKTANAMSARFGEDVIKILLNDPDKAAHEIKGLSLARARECSLKTEAEEKYLKIIFDLMLLGLSYDVSDRIHDLFGEESLIRVRENPYCLMSVRGLGFEVCESLANETGFGKVNPQRFEAAEVSVLTQLHQNTGNTFFYPETVKKETLKKIGSLPEEYGEECVSSFFDEAFEAGVKDGYIVIYRFKDNKCEGCSHKDEGARVALKSIFLSEAGIKREIESFIKAKKKISDRKEAGSRVLKISADLGYSLEEDQINALIMCLQEPLCIITGGPGTGKTTITGILAEHFRKEKISAEFCAPTGRAAKRLSEASGVKANTIHRLLGMSAESGDDGRAFFGKNKDNPLSARVVVVDEASMIDTVLLKALLNAVKKDASVILIGDPDQLPSVGAGNILADLLSFKLIPRVSLKYVFRQENESSIASNSVRILNGEMPVGNDLDFRIISFDDDNKAAHALEQLYKENRSDTAVLSPTKINELGTVSLNKILQDSVRKKDMKEKGLQIRPDLMLYEGDRVMQIRNNYSIEYYDPSEMETGSGIFNGELGEVGKTDFLTGKTDIFFDDGRRVLYDRKMLEDIDLSYAMTVHKAQGCEFDTVIIALGKMNYRLSNRKLLYTAVTRGKKQVIIVDSCSRLAKMVKNDEEEKRQTSLGDFLSIIESRVKIIEDP